MRLFIVGSHKYLLWPITTLTTKKMELLYTAASAMLECHKAQTAYYRIPETIHQQQTAFCQWVICSLLCHQSCSAAQQDNLSGQDYIKDSKRLLLGYEVF